MSNLMKLIGTILALGGIILGVLTFVKPGVMDVYGIKLDTAAILFIGGILALGLGAVIDALHTGNVYAAMPAKSVNTVAELQKIAAALPETPQEAASSVSNFGRKTTEVAGATGSVAAGAAMSTKAIKPDPVAETINALEQAKADVIKSMGGMESLTPPPPEPGHLSSNAAQAKHEGVSNAQAEAEAEIDDGDLYVVDEKVIRGRPARILSDDTVEAETDEGWMRFENVEHLNEYLDSVEEQSA